MRPGEKTFCPRKETVFALALLVSALPATADPERTAEAPPPDPGYPAVHFNYGFVPFDRTCSRLADFEIRQEWIEELHERLEFFQEYWDREGPVLLATAVSEIGKSFRQQEMIATMSLCKIPSMSHPLLINMRRFLASATPGEPSSPRMFVALVFHELLHTYVVDHMEESGLRRKYEGEPGSVQSHLHLLAILQTVYLKLGRREELAEIIAQDTKIGPIYARAWEIVQKEGHAPFVTELKK